MHEQEKDFKSSELHADTPAQGIVYRASVHKYDARCVSRCNHGTGHDVPCVTRREWRFRADAIGEHNIEPFVTLVAKVILLSSSQMHCHTVPFSVVSGTVSLFPG